MHSKLQLSGLPFYLQDISETKLERLVRAPGILHIALNHIRKNDFCEAEEKEYDINVQLVSFRVLVKVSHKTV